MTPSVEETAPQRHLTCPLIAWLAKFAKAFHRNRKRACADRDVRLAHADDIEERRSGQEGAAAAEQAEHEAHDRARADCGEDRAAHARPFHTPSCKVIPPSMATTNSAV